MGLGWTRASSTQPLGVLFWVEAARSATEGQDGNEPSLYFSASTTIPIVEAERDRKSDQASGNR